MTYIDCITESRLKDLVRKKITHLEAEHQKFLRYAEKIKNLHFQIIKQIDEIRGVLNV